MLSAINAGVWRPRAISTPELTVSNDLGVVPATPAGLTSLAALNVRGSNWPVLRVVPSPRPSPWHAFAAHGTATLSRTHAAAIGLPIALTGTFMCGEMFTDLSRVATTHVLTSGAFAATSWDRTSTWCAAYGIDAAGQAAGQASADDLGGAIRTVVRAAPASSTVVHGTDVRVTGQYWPQNESPVALQRLVGHTWHVVSRGYSRSSGRFTLTATPPRVGTTTYRVAVQGLAGERITSGSSPTFVIRAR